MRLAGHALPALAPPMPVAAVRLSACADMRALCGQPARSSLAWRGRHVAAVVKGLSNLGSHTSAVTKSLHAG